MKIYLRNIANSPYVVCVIAWTLCLFLYSLNGAGILPHLTLNLFAFIFFFLALFGVTAFFLKKINFTITPIKHVKINCTLLLITDSLLFLPNFAYSGIPLINGARADTFGVPGLMIFAVSVNAFACLCCYYMYLTTGKKKYFFGVFYGMLLFILLFSRGSIMETAVTMFLLWMIVKNPVLTFKKIAVISVSVLLILYLFGVVGNIRTADAIKSFQTEAGSNPGETEYSSDAILSLGDASDAFTNNLIPGEFFWSYLYLTSPISNLQYNVNLTSPPFTAGNLGKVIVNETMFDFLSKRIDAIDPDLTRKDPLLVLDPLTVGTTLAGSYANAGWGGMIYFMIVLWLLPLFYIPLMAKNPLATLGIAVLSTIYLFSAFDNMLVLSGLSLQLFYPGILMLFKSIKFNAVPRSATVGKIS